MNGSITKNKKTGKWDFIFNAGKDPLTGKRKQIRRRGFNSKREATTEMTKLKAQISENEFLDINKITYSNYIGQWIQERKSVLQESTFEIHSILLKNVILPRLGTLKLQELSPIHIQKFVTDLVNEKHYSVHTIHLLFRIVNSSLRKAKILKLIKECPSEGITLPKVQKKEMNVWSIDEVNFFITNSKKVNRLTRCYIGFLFALLTGMRQGEILGLRWRDIDFENQTIYIRQTLTQKAQVKVGAKNQSSIRSLHIPKKMIFELKAHKAHVLKEKLASGQNYEDNDLVLCTQKGRPTIPRNFRKEFYKLTKTLGLPKIRFHDLRHTHATILIQQNVNVKLISERLGHAEIGTTLDTYSHVLPNMQKSVSDELDKIIQM